jgi:hypothetical protein
VKVDEWHRGLVIDGLATLEVDDATDQSVREALRETIADVRGEYSSPSLALQVVCKLLEEPNMNFKGPIVHSNRGRYPNRGRYYDRKRAYARRSGLGKLMGATLSTYQRFFPDRPSGSGPGYVSNWNNPLLRTVEELEHAPSKVLTLQLIGKNNPPSHDHVQSTHSNLAGKNPLHAYDPESRLAALWLLTRLPSVESNGFLLYRVLDHLDDGTPFAEERRYVNHS